VSSERDIVERLREHKLKTWPVFFQEVADGTKTFELRKNDRNFCIGDVLTLVEWDPQSQTYTGRVIHKAVGYMTDGSGLGCLADGWVAMSLIDVPTDAAGALGKEAGNGRD